MSYNLPLTEAQRAFAAVLPFSPKSDVTGAICTVNVTTQGHILTTDRYTIGRYKLDPNSDAYTLPEVDFTMPRDAAEWIARILPKSLNAHVSQYEVRMTDPDDRAAGFLVEIAFIDDGPVEVSRSFYIDFTTNFPPVDRLFPPSVDEIKDHQGPTAYATEHLLKFAVTAKVIYGTRKGSEPVMRMRPLAGYSPSKPGPTYITIGDRFDGLLQPNLILR